MNNCPNCGSSVNQGEAFCKVCGTKMPIPQTNFFNNTQQSQNNNTNMLQQQYQDINNNQIGTQSITFQQQSNDINNSVGGEPYVELKSYYKWWLHLLLIIIPYVISMVINIVFVFNSDEHSGMALSSLFSTLIAFVLVPLTLICYPIICHIRYSSKKTTKLIKENILKSNLSDDEKLIAAYIKVGYHKAINKKFSFKSLFYSYFYILYKKYYIQVIIVCIVLAVIGAIMPDWISTICGLGFNIYLAINFNKLHYEHAKKAVSKIKEENKEKDTEELVEICLKKGGTNLWAVVILICAVVLIGFALPQTKKDVDAGIWGLKFSIPSNFSKQNEEIAFFTYEVEYDASSVQYCTFKLLAQNNAADIEPTFGLHSPDSSYLYKDYSSIEGKSINSNTWYYQTKNNNTYNSYFYSTKHNDIYYFIEFKIGNDNTQCYDDYMKIISSLKFNN